MNLIQMEFGVLPVKVLKEDKADIEQYAASVEEKMVDILLFIMADKRETKTEDIVSRFGFTITTAKRYLRQLTAFGYLESHGGNKNRTYVLKRSPGLGLAQNDKENNN